MQLQLGIRHIYISTNIIYYDNNPNTSHNNRNTTGST